MRAGYLILVIALSSPGCQLLFSTSSGSDLSASDAADGDSAVASIDASNLPCVDPMLEDWTYLDVHDDVDPFSFIFHPALTADRRLIFAKDGKLFQSAFDGNNSEIGGLAETGLDNRSPSLSPDGNSLYFAQHSDADGAFASVQRWHRDQVGMIVSPVEFTIDPMPTTIEPGAPGLYRGETRMVVSASFSGGSRRLIEMRASGDDSWVEAPASISWSAGDKPDSEPYLSADGCVLLFSSRRNVSASDIYIAVREESGNFGLPRRLTDGSNDHHGPVLSPGGTRYLYTVNSSMQQLVQSGTPPP